MKAKDFILVLRKVIREEVKTAVRHEIRAVLAEQKVPSTHKPHTKLPNGQQLGRVPPVVFDGPLSSILNETANSMYSSPQQEEWQDVGGGTFTADQAQGFGLSALMNQETGVADPTPSHFAGDPTMAFVKDYSAVMKAADKISNRQH